MNRTKLTPPAEKNAKRPKRWHWLFLALVLLSVTALIMLIAKPAAQTGQPSASLALNGQTEKADDIAALFAPDRISQLENLGIDVAAVGRFYAMREYKPAWTGAASAKSDAKLALNALADAGDQGLDPAVYQAGGLKLWTQDVNPVLFDVLLSDAVLRYARDVRVGRIVPAAVYSDVNLPKQTFDAVAGLLDALAARNLAQMLDALPPAYPEYGRLKSALAAYRAMAIAGDWPRIPDGSAKTLAADDPRLTVLRARLAREDSVLSAADSGSFDALVLALRRYQTRNGLEPDAKLGPQTMAMLNIAPAGRVAQIEANMERWRWLPRWMERRHIMVNAADATLQLTQEDKVVLASKVVVGEARKPTPMFRAEVRDVTVNPPWNVPDSIARNEILPQLRRNPDYLRSHNMILVNGPPDDPHGTRIDWRKIAAGAFPYRIQQRPGPDNALGKLKLEMPNSFNVYLHDTPGKKAFDKANRNLSHGCVRVEQIKALAELALAGAIAPVEELDVAIAGTETKRLRLSAPLPVYVLYWTAFVDTDGGVQFRRDVYKRDERLLTALRADKSWGPAECGTATH